MPRVWLRTRRFLAQKVLHTDDTPHAIALGAALAVFVAFLPLIGLQTVIAIGLAALFRANKAVCVPIVWITNPFSAVPIYTACLILGRAIWPVPAVQQGTSPVSRLEALQAMIERRAGGETGLAAVEHLGGDAVWKAEDDGLWSRELAAAAAEAGKLEGVMEGACEDPHAFLLQYRDGFRATLLQLNGFTRQWIYAARVGGDINATALVANDGPPYGHFGYLAINIEEMFVTGVPQYPVERTLLVTGGLDAIMDQIRNAISVGNEVSKKSE